MRIYAPGRGVKLSTLRLLEDYNTQEDLKNEKGDRKFITIILKEFFGHRELINNILDENVLKLVQGEKHSISISYFKIVISNFVPGFFSHRVEGDVGRMKKFNEHVKIILETGEKQNKL